MQKLHVLNERTFPSPFLLEEILEHEVRFRVIFIKLNVPVKLILGLGILDLLNLNFQRVAFHVQVEE
jgi:hypothetical protein